MEHALLQQRPRSIVVLKKTMPGSSSLRLRLIGIEQRQEKPRK